MSDVTANPLNTPACPKAYAERPDAIILAAGKGTRMGGDQAKVLFEVAGRPMVLWVIEACRAVGVERCVLVVGYQAEQVIQAIADAGYVAGQPAEDGFVVTFVEQTEQLGTGHAAKMAAALYESSTDCNVFVLCGDGPLIRTSTLNQVLNIHAGANTNDTAATTLATAILDDPTGYGRVIRDEQGGFDRIVEQKDGIPEQLAIQEVNPSYYCFRAGDLFGSLNQVDNNNKQGEYYLTDVPGLHKQQGKTVRVVDAVPAEDVLGINTQEHLAVVDATMRKRLAQSNSGTEATSGQSKYG